MAPANTAIFLIALFMNQQGDKCACPRSEDSRAPAPQESPANQQGMFAEQTLLDRDGESRASLDKPHAAPWIAKSVGTKPWLKNHYGMKTRFANLRAADLVFVGDSLTEFWTSMGKPVWEAEFSRNGITAANAGVSADCTEHILWRLNQGNIGLLKPKGFIVMAGTNNLAMRPNPDTPEDVAKGVEGIVITLQRISPGAEILVLSITPSGKDPDLAARIQKTNPLLKAMTGRIKDVEFLDLWSAFSDENSRLKPELTVDGTHFSQRGYDQLARAIRPIWNGWFKKQ